MANDKDISNKAYEAIEIARKTGKIKKGSNEATKIIERGLAKLVVVASDVNPPEVIMHIEPLCQEKNAPFVKVPSKEELGAAAGLSVPTSCVVIIKEGDSKDIIKELSAK
ncbi:50S ribosomal protein L7ae [Candidatus Woesearchaeota archaeon]|nr:50S ribosomal protein L7ae [Candidatus Woesearchaeota archaeon]